MAIVESAVRFPGDGHLGRGVLIWPDNTSAWHPAVIVNPGATGIGDSDLEAGRWLAGEGYVALIVDPFSSLREEEIPRERTYEGILPLFGSLDDRAYMIDLDHAFEFLVTLPGVRRDRIAVLGFCAAWSLMFACVKPQLRACVAFYNALRYGEGSPRHGLAVQPVDRIPNLWTPVLYHRGEDDPYQAPEALAELHRLAEQHDKSVEMHYYPGCGHGFAERGGAYVPEQAALAWRRTSQFLARHLGDREQE